MSIESPDLTALSWCLGEIRESLSRAEVAIEAQLAQGDDDRSQTTIARTIAGAHFMNCDLPSVQRELDAKLKSLDGKAWVSVNKALVTQASSAIPVVPLYISLLYKVMKAEGTHEDCIEQMDRLFRDRLYNGNPQPDEAGRIRIDDWEMAPVVQKLVDQRWTEVNTDNLRQIADFDGYQAGFLKLFGFGLNGVDYTADVDTAVKVPSLG